MTESVTGRFTLNGAEYDFSPAITNTQAMYGKNQPFMCVEIAINRYLFDSLSFWQKNNPSLTITSCPKPVQNSTIIHLVTYGGTYDVLYTQTKNPSDSEYTLICYSTAYMLKTSTTGNLIGSVTWSGGGESSTGPHHKGSFTLTYTDRDGKSTAHTVTLPTGVKSSSARDTFTDSNIQIINPSEVHEHCSSKLSERNKKPTVSLGTLRVLIPIYTDTNLPTSDDGNYGFMEYDSSKPAVYNKNKLYGVTNLSPQAVYASVKFTYTLPLTWDAMWQNMGTDRTIAYDDGNSYTVQEMKDGVLTDVTETQTNSVMYCQGVEYVCGYTQALLSWMVNGVTGYSGEYVIDPGLTTWDMYSSGHEVLEEYTLDELETMTEGGDRMNVDRVCKLYNDSNCYDTIKSMGVLTGRWMYFSDKPYFTSFDSIVNPTESETLDYIRISYDVSDEISGLKFVRADGTVGSARLASDVIYDDQGSEYVVTRQSVTSPIEATVKISDVYSVKDGDPISINEVQDGGLDVSKMGNQLVLNELLRNYAPSTSLYFYTYENSSEQTVRTYTVYLTREVEESTHLPVASKNLLNRYYAKYGVADQHLYRCDKSGDGYVWTTVTPSEGETCVVYSEWRTYNETFTNNAWKVDTNMIPVQRDELFVPSTRVGKIFDTRASGSNSEISLTNVPLAYTVVSWPACSTLYMFGKPQFEDSEQTVSELKSKISSSVSTTTVSSSLSSGNTTTIAIGESTSSSIDTYTSDTDLSTFSGIISRKNSAMGVASIDGYDNGRRQARFSSTGSISSGTIYDSDGEEIGDSVVMDKNGFTTRSWQTEVTEEGVTYPAHWQTECTVGVDGKITAGGGQVKLDSNGFSTYDSEGNLKCSIDSETGNIKGVDATVESLSADKITSGAISAKEITMGDDGNIIAGEYTKDASENITLTDGAMFNKDGLTVNGDGNSITIGKYVLDSNGLKYGNTPIIDSSSGMITFTVDATSVDGALSAATLSASNITAGTISTKEAITIGSGSSIYTISGGSVKYNGAEILKHNSTGNYDELNLFVNAVNIKGSITADSVKADNVTAGTLNSNVLVSCEIDAGLLKTSSITASKITLDGGSIVAGGTTLNKDGVSTKQSTNKNGTTLTSSGLTTTNSSGYNTARLTSTGLFAVGGAGNATMRTYDGRIYFYPKGSYIHDDGSIYTAQNGGSAVSPTAFITDDGTVMGLAVGSVNSDQIVSSAITETKISDSAISTPKLSAECVTAAKIAAGTITADKIAAGTITSNEISSNYVYAGNISADQIKSGTIQSIAYVNTDTSGNMVTTIDEDGAIRTDYGYITTNTKTGKENRVAHTVMDSNGLQLRGYLGSTASWDGISFMLPTSTSATETSGWDLRGYLKPYFNSSGDTVNMSLKCDGIGSSGMTSYDGSMDVTTTGYELASFNNYIRTSLSSSSAAMGQWTAVGNIAAFNFSMSTGLEGNQSDVTMQRVGASDMTIGVTNCSGITVGSTGNLNVTLNHGSSGTSSVTATTFNGTATTATTANGVSNDCLKTLLKAMYPIGSIYFTTNDKCPSDSGGVFYNMGMTWEAYGSGRVPVGVGSATDEDGVSKELAGSSGATGGRFAPSMPSHSHGISVTLDKTSLTGHIRGAITQNSSATRADGIVTDLDAKQDTSWNSSDKVGNGNGWTSKGAYIDASHSHSVTTVMDNASSGDTTTGNAMPYIGVYMWRRTA